MRLKKIRLAGFKSFVDPTNIPFPGDMTAVVGPNGCGKSNVIDAVRWVLGESSAKNLRGDAMTDVIFNGSSARKPVSQCSVELVFDNSLGRIAGEFANYSELSVKRIVTKDAISSYLLNGTKCRRRDITDLFLGTGLGPRSYAIIEQGMISRLIESKPQELRVFIEEAAGISKYKERRKETLNRIAHTKDNLSRLEDVRQELGDQLAKLKRQATAANRYKELKAQERELKGQLSTLRWLAQSALLKRSDDIIAEHQQELENLLSSKQGDESGLQMLKNEQSIAKQHIFDLQQEVYRLGNDITKLEQSQLFARKRGSQIQAEIQQIVQQSQQLETQLAAIDNEIASNQIHIIDAEPEKIILQEQLDELEHSQSGYQQQSKSLSGAVKLAEDRYYQSKQLLQQKHSQLQQTLSLQQRTVSRISELKQERTEIAQQELNNPKALEKELIGIEQEISQLEKQHSMAINEVEFAQQRRDKADTDTRDSKTRCIQAEAELKALEQLQTTPSEGFAKYLDGHTLMPSWQAFHAMSGYERALETALSLFEDALVIDNLKVSQIISASEHGAQPLFFSVDFSDEKRERSLASYVVEGKVPNLFNSILVAQDSSDAERCLQNLQGGDIVITKKGEVLTHDIFMSAEKATDGKIIRSARIQTLQKQLIELNLLHTSESKVLQREKEKLEAALANKNDIEMALNNKRNDHAFVLRDINNANMLKARNDARLRKLDADIEHQEDALHQEQLSCEILTEEIEEASLALVELEEDKRSADADKQGLDVQLEALSNQLKHTQQRLHEHALLNQRLQNSHQILQEQRKNKYEQLQDNQEKQQLLQEEAENLLLPSEEQQERLQSMLGDKTRLEEEQHHKQQNLTELEEQIATLEKGQVGVMQKVDRIKQLIESERLSAQTAKVKAQGLMEQLADMKLSVKDVLETLPEDAQEPLYQQKLDEVSTQLSRLGAVNLAAVAEYDEQAVRKQHLDDQNMDLTQALETLENAMRKIDKETRTRFKHTFDQVNGDLKTLFPKVFGGGTAYLALTDDDLLDTGVTIMARPPGKKNSTIALLSGGEKALTALSLVFAIFRLNPAPFCLLDEVDAPLDDANVGRFCKLVSEMSKTVQFIYITHNKVAMEMATHLTGVTMAEPGVSRMVAVDMDEALAIAE